MKTRLMIFYTANRNNMQTTTLFRLSTKKPFLRTWGTHLYMELKEVDKYAKEIGAVGYVINDVRKI